jgi:hypothetical protein
MIHPATTKFQSFVETNSLNKLHIWYLQGGEKVAVRPLEAQRRNALFLEDD